MIKPDKRLNDCKRLASNPAAHAQSMSRRGHVSSFRVLGLYYKRDEAADGDPLASKHGACKRTPAVLKTLSDRTVRSGGDKCVT